MKNNVCTIMQINCKFMLLIILEKFSKLLCVHKLTNPYAQFVWSIEKTKCDCTYQQYVREIKIT